MQILDWNLASISVREADLHSLASVLKSVSADRIIELRKHATWIYRQYFSSIKQIVLTVLDELNDRIFPHLAKNYLQWNMPKNTVSLCVIENMFNY